MSSEKPCDIVPTETAKFAYRWEWGDEGICGATGRVLLEQQAGNLNRHIAFTDLTVAESAPVERAERVAYKAQQFALEEELKETQASRGALLDEVTRLRADNRLATIQLQNYKPENARLTAAVTQLSAENLKLTSQVADQANDLAALRESVRAGDLAVLSERLAVLEAELADSEAARGDLEAALADARASVTVVE